MNALGTALVDCVVQVTMFAFALGAVYVIASRRDPAAAARTVVAGLFGVMLLTVLCWSPWPNWSNALEGRFTHIGSPSTLTANSASHSQADAPTADDDNRHALSDSTATEVWPETLRSLWDGLKHIWVAEIAAPAAATTWTWRALVVGIFVVTAAVGLMRLFGGLLCVANMRRGSVPLDEPKLNELAAVLRAELGCTAPVSLGQCRQLATAATVGWKRPLILLPVNWRTWSQRELRAILAHEMAHVHRRDFASHVVAQVALALHFYHPLVHWLVRRLRLEQELAADAAAARIAGGRRSYLTTLAGLALAQPPERLAWPVHAFLPTQRMFVRRIEMLRDRRMPVVTSRGSRAQQRAVGWLTAVVLCGAALAVIGLRTPTRARAQVQVADAPNRSDSVPPDNQQVQQPAVHAGQYNFSYIPENTMALLAIRQAELAADPRLKPLADLIEQSTRPALTSNLVEQVALLMVAPKLDERGLIRAGSGGEQVVIHTTEPVDFMPHLKKGYPNLTTMQDGGHDLMVISPSPSTMSFFATDKQTLLGRVRSGLVELVNSADAAGPPRGADAWQAAAKGPILVVAQTGPASIVFKGRADVVTALLSPMLAGAETIMLSVEPGENLKLHGRLLCKSPDDAKRVAETLEAIAVFARSAVDVQRQRVTTQQSSTARDYMPLLDLVDKCLAGREITLQDSSVVVELTVGNTADSVRLIVEALAPAIEEARAAARNAASINILRQIAIAMLTYCDSHKALPPAVLIGPDGKTPHSWRVALLPYLGHEALYKRYRLDQPWDSPDNLKVLAQMPDVYRHPQDVAGSTNASYFVVTGPDTVFARTNGEGVRLTEIIDGTSKTLLAVEAKRDIPWTKPEDIAYAADQPVPQLGGWTPHTANVALCDGSVRTISVDERAETMLRAMITRAGREPAPAPY